jgi:hypothetical protein
VHKNVSVHSVLSNIPLNVCFRQILGGANWVVWMHLCGQLLMIQLNGESNRFAWKLFASGLFIVKSMYEDLMNSDNHFRVDTYENLKYSCGSLIERFYSQKII